MRPSSRVADGINPPWVNNVDPHTALEA